MLGIDGDLGAVGKRSLAWVLQLLMNDPTVILHRFTAIGRSVGHGVRGGVENTNNLAFCTLHARHVISQNLHFTADRELRVVSRSHSLGSRTTIGRVIMASHCIVIMVAVLTVVIGIVHVTHGVRVLRAGCRCRRAGLANSAACFGISRIVGGATGQRKHAGGTCGYKRIKWSDILCHGQAPLLLMSINLCPHPTDAPLTPPGLIARGERKSSSRPRRSAQSW